MIAAAIQKRPWRTAAASMAAVAVVVMVGIVVSPWFADTTTYGFHDWDVVTSFRYLVKISLLEYHEFPGWNPYACGGYPLWGYVEGGTTLVSPWLPVYLLAPLSLAIRIEVTGMGLLGAIGAYCLGARFTKSHGARLLVAALWAVNGRWGLQTAAGHTWHLAYAYMPWCLFFFERACAPDARRVREIALLGTGLALLVYSGGIYPLPHTVLALGLYAGLRAAFKRSLQPIFLLAAAGLVGIGLAAPKLLPMLDTFTSDPRLIESTEQLDPGAFVSMLTHPQQHFYARPAKVSPYGWHEWGMYISPIGLGVIGLAALFGRGPRKTPLKIVGITFLVLGFGAFHPWAPWTLMHAHVPLFQSQHVPSRFLYPAVLLLALVAAAHVGHFVDRRARRYPWMDVVLVIAVTCVGIDVARVAQQPMKDAMWMVAPDIPQGRKFHFERNPPFHYERRDWVGPMLLSMMANTGVLNCYGIPRGPKFKPGAIAKRSRRYRGEAYLVDRRGRAQPGSASITRWSPNTATIEVRGAPPNSLVVYNMKYRRGWASSQGAVLPMRGSIAVPLEQADATIRLAYRPPRLGLGLALMIWTVLMLVAFGREEAM